MDNNHVIPSVSEKSLMNIRKDPHNFPFVSVIITTKNEEKNIENCLKSITVQTYPHGKIEIIVVDNNSTDKTKIIAKRYANLVLDKGPERSAQRNFGIKMSHAEWILYLDADMILSKNVIFECVNIVFKNSKIIGLYIPEIIMGDSFWNKVRRFERSFYNGTVIDAVRFVNKAVFNKVGGFDKTISGPEDWDFDKKVKLLGKVDIITAPLYHNEGGFNLKTYLNKKSYYIKSFNKYISKWGRDDPDIKKQFGFYYRYFGVFLKNGKWREIIQHPILTLGMYFLKGLVGLKFLFKRI